MLQSLYIKNYAIIDELEISFHQGLTVLTGETGAGKSIILGALSLILGERADTSVLIDKGNKCIIEAVFDTENNKQVAVFLEKEDLDWDKVTRVRREINTSGKSRAFINDTPAQLKQLQQLGDLLVDLNRQFDNRLLHQSSEQYEIVDSFSENIQLIDSYRIVLKQYQHTLQTLELKREQEKNAQAETDYLNFILEELEEANWQPNEIEELEEKIKSAQHQEDINQVIVQSGFILSEADENINAQIRKLMSDWQAISPYFQKASPLTVRLESVWEELKDITQEIESFQDEIRFDPEELSLWNERLDFGFRLLKKHNLNNTEELISLQEKLSLQLSDVHSLSDQIIELEGQLNVLEKELSKHADKIFANRQKAIPNIEKNLMKILAKIGMETAQIKIQLQTVEHFNYFGKDEMAFLIDANKSGQFLPISKAASGGELSRLLLAIKSLVSKNLELPTLIFDEVDAAISGEAAKQVAILMQSLADQHQIIVLTHQAQMAARANRHYFVYKENNSENNKIQTRLQVLNEDERVEKIAQMIGGSNPGDAAILSAQELLKKTIA